MENKIKNKLLQQKEFSRELNGYASNEVDNYIDSLFAEIDKLTYEKDLLLEQIENDKIELQNKINDYEKKIFEIKMEQNRNL